MVYTILQQFWYFKTFSFSVTIKVLKHVLSFLKCHVWQKNYSDSKLHLLITDHKLYLATLRETTFCKILFELTFVFQSCSTFKVFNLHAYIVNICVAKRHKTLFFNIQTLEISFALNTLLLLKIKLPATVNDQIDRWKLSKEFSSFGISRFQSSYRLSLY